MSGASQLLLAAAVWTAGAAVSGCNQDQAPGADPEWAARALAEAEQLAARHRVAEALAVVQSALSGRSGSGAPAAGPELALRERQGTLLLGLARPREAAAILEEVLRLEPGKHATRRWLAQAYLESGEREKAARTFATLPDPLAPEVLVSLGNALVEAERGTEGAHAIAAALVRDPWLDKGYLAFGRALVRLGNAERGKAFLERYRATDGLRRAEQEVLAFESAGDAARALLRRARLERERGRLFEAMELWNGALRSNPGLGEAYLDLAQLSVFLARPEDALRVLEQLPPEARTLAITGDAHAAAGDVERARAAYREALGKDSILARASEGLARLEGRGAASGTGPGAEREAALDDRRREIAGRIRTKPLSRCASDLLPLAAALASAGRGREARDLGLFLVRLDPGNREARLALLDLCRHADEAFLRLWALDGSEDPDLEGRLGTEVAELGLDLATLRGFLARSARPLKP